MRLSEQGSATGHFAFLAPCSVELAAAIPRICTVTPAEFDRAAFHREFNAAVVRFFRGQLAGGDHWSGLVMTIASSNPGSASVPAVAGTPDQRFTSTSRVSGSIHIANVLTAHMAATYQAGAIGSWVTASSQVTTN